MIRGWRTEGGQRMEGCVKYVAARSIIRQVSTSIGKLFILICTYNKATKVIVSK